MRQTENRRQRRIIALKHENALLEGVLCEIIEEIARLQQIADRAVIVMPNTSGG